jgi:hypothetical protein
MVVFKGCSVFSVMERITACSSCSLGVNYE